MSDAILQIESKNRDKLNALESRSTRQLVELDKHKQTHVAPDLKGTCFVDIQIVVSVGRVLLCCALQIVLATVLILWHY